MDLINEIGHGQNNGHFREHLAGHFNRHYHGHLIGQVENWEIE